MFVILCCPTSTCAVLPKAIRWSHRALKGAAAVSHTQTSTRAQTHRVVYSNIRRPKHRRQLLKGKIKMEPDEDCSQQPRHTGLSLLDSRVWQKLMGGKHGVHSSRQTIKIRLTGIL